MDREARQEYDVVIQAKDMGGHMGGLSGTTEVKITLTDVNDNPPKFPQSEYKHFLYLAVYVCVYNIYCVTVCIFLWCDISFRGVKESYTSPNDTPAINPAASSPFLHHTSVHVDYVNPHTQVCTSFCMYRRHVCVCIRPKKHVPR